MQNRHHSFTPPQNTTNCWHGCTVRIVSLSARRSLCVRRRASIHWFRTSRCLPIPKTAVKASPDAEPPSFLYTAAKHYELLAWMHSADRFPFGATIFVREAQGKHQIGRAHG